MNTKENILLIGGGGHCKACIDVIEQENKYNIIGIIDRENMVGKTVLGYPVVDFDDNLEKWLNKSKNVLITVGHIKSPELRIKLYNHVQKLGFFLPKIISPKAYVSKHAVIGKGTIVMHGVVVNANATIGNNCIINNQSLIEHDAEIGNHTHVSTGAKVNGGAIVGNNCFIGSGAIINQSINTCSDVVLGAGTLVTKDILKKGLYVGIPAKKIK